MRALAVLLLAVVVASPERPIEGESVEQKPAVTVLLDRSSSMSLLAPGLAERWLDERREGLERVARVTRIDHSGSSATDRDATEAERSPLRSTLEGVLSAGSAPDHLVLLTDGIDTQGETISGMETHGAHVHALILEADEAPIDARIMMTLSSPLAYDGQPTSLEVRIQQRGLEGRLSRLFVERDGQTVHEQSVRLDSALTSVLVPVVPELPEGVTQGTVEYTVRLDPLAGEVEDSNNTSTVLVRVSAEPIRVLVLEGQPHWDTRFFVRAMRSDGQIEVTSASTLDDRFRAAMREPRVRVTRSGGDGNDRDVRLPRSGDELAAYDVIAVGRGVEQFFPGLDAERLRDAVTERGRSILFFRGDPVVSSAPEAVRTSRVLLDLLEAPEERVFEPGVLRRAGVGVVMTVERPPGHRDALLPPGASAEARSAFARMWSRVVRTLATGSGMSPGAGVELRVLPATAPPDVQRTIRVRARSSSEKKPARVTLTSPSGEAQAVELAEDPGNPLIAQAVVRAEEDGVWRVSDGGALETRFVVVEDRVERTLLTPRTDDLRSLARTSGGLVFTMADGADRVIEAIQSDSVSRAAPALLEPVWSRWWWAATARAKNRTTRGPLPKWRAPTWRPSRPTESMMPWPVSWPAS